MIRKIIFTVCVVYSLFLTEAVLFDLAGRWFLPNLLLLGIIYFDLAFGLRYSLSAAVLAGVLQDSYGTGMFGWNIFTYVLCSLLTTGLKRYLHYVASRRSRLMLVFCVTSAQFFVYFCLQGIWGKVDVTESIKFIFLPEMLTTLIVTSFVFNQLRKCVLKLFV